MTPHEAIRRLAAGALRGQIHEAERLINVGWQELLQGLAAIVRAYTPDKNLQEECIQEAMLHVWKRRRHYRGKTRGEYWNYLSRICRNVYVDKLRASRTRRSASTEPEKLEEYAAAGHASSAQLADDPVVQATNEETHAVVENCLLKLAADEREVIHLRYLLGLTLEETAEALSCATATVWRRQQRAIEQLRECLERKGIE